MKHLALVVIGVVVALAALARTAHAEEPSRATFALIVGSNQSVDAELAPLKYADDDAARYFDLFRLLGARTYLLTRLDENTHRLHAQAAAEAAPPRKDAFDAAVAQLSADVAQAQARGVETIVYVVYAGHGNVRNGEGYVTLEDARITGSDLAAVLARIPAARIHVVADACASYFLAYGRGPGGQRRAIEGLPSVHALAADPRVGLLLSTSSARESHEWDAFQSGVFSHEVRSGLYGAADADGDGLVTYREIAAFVARANAAVPNDRFRPDVHVRSPRGGDTLLDLRRARGRRLEIDGKHAAHYFLEDARGVRLLDVHNAAGQTLSLVRPPPTGPVFLHRVDDDKELAVPAGEDVVSVADLSAEDPRIASRGAAHEAFSLLFTMPFDRAAVDDWREPAAAAGSDAVPPRPPAPSAERGLGTRRVIGLGAMGLGVALAGAGLGFSLAASSVHGDLPASPSQADVAAANQRIESRDTMAAVGYVSGGALFAAGAVLFFWPAAKHVRVTARPGGGVVGWGASF